MLSSRGCKLRGGAVSGGAMAGPAMWAAWSADASVAFLQDVGSRTIGKWTNVVVGRLYPAAEHASFRREGFQRRREKDVQAFASQVRRPKHTQQRGGHELPACPAPHRKAGRVVLGRGDV